MFCTLKLDPVIIRQKEEICLWMLVRTVTVAVAVLSPFSPERGPSIRVPHHHGQAAPRVRGIRGKLLCVMPCVCLCFIARGLLAICVCVCMCACVCLSACVLSVLVNSAEGEKAMASLYPLQSSVSIIEEWYLQRGTGVKGGAQGWR